MRNLDKLNIARSQELFEEAKTLIPGGVLGARKPSDFIEGEYPIFLESGKGCRLIDVDGNEYIDFLCGYGPIILGYREEEVDEAVISTNKRQGVLFHPHPALSESAREKAEGACAIWGTEHLSEDGV